MPNVWLTATVTQKRWSVEDGWSYGFSDLEFGLNDPEFKLEGALSRSKVDLWVTAATGAANLIANHRWDMEQLQSDRKVRDDTGCAWIHRYPEDGAVFVTVSPGTLNEGPLFSLLDTALSSESLVASLSFTVGFSAVADNPYSRSPTVEQFLEGAPAFAGQPFGFAAVRRQAK